MSIGRVATDRVPGSVSLGWMEAAPDHLVAGPARTGLFLDFDGTLSEIVMFAADARPIPGVPELLRALSRTFGLVAIVSGRSARQLSDWLGPDVEIWGVHGAETNRSGSVELTERAAAFTELMVKVREDAQDAVSALDLSGVFIEDKGVMLGLHFRAADDVERARMLLDEVAEELARRHGLRRAGGRLAFELRPPEDFTKAAVVLARAREEKLAAVMFMGDDRVDLAGFDALDILAKEGAATMRIAIDSTEAPPELLERADLVLESPKAAVAWLEQLLDHAGGG